MNTNTVEKGSVLGGILLVAGSAIGAGMLGLPMVTGGSGFLPSLVVFAFCWVFMSTTALLLLEANLASGKDSNIMTMAYKSLGPLGKGISFFIYIFLFYSMLVAYVDGSGVLTREFFQKTFNLGITRMEGGLFFTLLFGVFVYLGTLFVDGLNRLFMVGLVASYVLVLVFGSKSVDSGYLTHKVWASSLLPIPVVIASFGYHNIIPTLTSYLGGDRKRMIFVVILGGAMPLLIYILWEWLILGVVPYSIFKGSPSFENVLTYIPYPKVSVLSQYFAFFAIVTSFLAQALALVDFLRDAFKVKKTLFNRFWLVLLVLTPPYFLAMRFPGIFIKALGYVGGFAAIILFVFIPAFMVWELRYRKGEKSYKIMPGGRLMLSCVVFIGLCIIALEVLQELFNISSLKELL